MTSAKATEFLTKQLSIEKETVTFRWLSRKLSVHVNVAKNELASFYASCRSTDVPVHATYLLTGDVAPTKAAGSYRDNDQGEMDMEDDNQESVATSKIVLVGEDDLEAAKTQFTRAPSVHIYSLSPSAINDAALLAPMADRVRHDDVTKGKAYNQIIGIVVGPDVKIGQTTKPGTSKLAKPNASSGSSSKVNTPAAAKKLAERPKSSEKGKPPEKPKQDEKRAGTLDWSKAKVKEEKEQENGATTTVAPKEIIKMQSKLVLKENGEITKPEVKKAEDLKVKVKRENTEANVNTKVIGSDKVKRGTKRPSAVMSLSDSEDDNPSPKTKARISASPPSFRPPSRASGIKVKKGVLLSDDDEERVNKVKAKTAKQKDKGRTLVAEEEEEEEEEEDEIDPSVRAMMDPNDSQVTRHNNQASSSDHKSNEDIEMHSGDYPMPVRPKKVIPVGKNGLPKRRVIRSRKSKNTKGYTVTEDYSSYESVSESEQVQATSDTEKKPKTRRKKSKMDDTEKSRASKAKGDTKSRDNEVNGHAAKTEGESQTVEGKSETKKTGSGSSGGGSTSRSGAKASSGGKNNLMSYFTKK